jgi:hypothetical protein
VSHLILGGSINKSEKIRKEAVVASFKVLYWHWPEKTERNHEICHIERPADLRAQNLKPGLPEYEPGLHIHCVVCSF